MSDANDPLTSARRPGVDGLLDRLFIREEINGAGRCPTYLIRWTVFQPRWGKRFWRGFGIYLHKFIGDDWSFDLHDHQKRFVSIGLKGSYYEATPMATDPRESVRGFVKWRAWKAPWVRTFPANHVHRIELMPDRRPCWTCVIVLRHVREWGFWHDGIFIHWKNYVHPSNKLSDSRKSCP